MRCRLLLLCAAAATVFAATEARAHCEIPCGIYGDDLRFSMLYEDITTIGVPNVLVVSSELDEDLVYQITSAMYENIAELRAVHPAAEETTVDFAMSATPVPLHEGAIRYFEEAGAEIPDDLRE